MLQSKDYYKVLTYYNLFRKDRPKYMQVAAPYLRILCALLINLPAHFRGYY